MWPQASDNLGFPPLPLPLGQPLRDVLTRQAHPQRLWEALGWGCCPSLLPFPRDPTLHSLRLSSRTAADPWGPSLLEQSLQPVLSRCDLDKLLLSSLLSHLWMEILAPHLPHVADL